MRVPEIATGIEPQPEIEHTDDTFNADRPSTTTALPKRGSSAKLIFTVIGLLIVLALIAVIAAVIYFLYLMPGPESTF